MIKKILIYKNFGGKFQLDKRKDGKILSKWSCAGSKSAEILKLIAPYLIGKKEQAQLALDYLETFCENPTFSGRTETEKELQELYRIKMHMLKES